MISCIGLQLIKRMDWSDYFDITNISYIPYSPEYPQWKYYSFNVVATKPFELFNLLQHANCNFEQYSDRIGVFIPRNIFQVELTNCNIIVQHKPIVPPNIIHIQHWLNVNMPDKHTVITYLRNLIKGDHSIMLFKQDFIDVLNHQILTHRTYHTLHAYLGTELFGEFYHG